MGGWRIAPKCYIYIAKTNFLGGRKKRGFWIGFGEVFGSILDMFLERFWRDFGEVFGDILDTFSIIFCISFWIDLG